MQIYKKLPNGKLPKGNFYYSLTFFLHLIIYKGDSPPSLHTLPHDNQNKKFLHRKACIPFLFSFFNFLFYFRIIRDNGIVQIFRTGMAFLSSFFGHFCCFNSHTSRIIIIKTIIIPIEMLS